MNFVWVQTQKGYAPEKRPDDTLDRNPVAKSYALPPEDAELSIAELSLKYPPP